MTFANLRFRRLLLLGRKALLPVLLLLGMADFWNDSGSLSKSEHLPPSAHQPTPISLSDTAPARGSTTLSTPPTRGAGGELPGTSLEVALDRARREIGAPNEEESALRLNEGVTHFAWNPGQDFTARFLAAGSVRFDSGDKTGGWQVGFRYSGAGTTSAVAVEGTRAEFLHRDGVREWFDNGSSGIEHGFTLDRRPPQGARLEIALDGMIAVRESPDNTANLLLQDTHGNARLRYAGLKAWDADGKDLLAAMDATPMGLAITVDDRDARYPLTIDPLITVLSQELDPLITGSGSQYDFFGCSVAFDGDTALIGAPHDQSASGKSDSGNAYIFIRSGEGVDETWTLQGRLGTGGAAENDCYGAAVALQGDIAVIGVPNEGSRISLSPGTVRVWARSNGQWTEQTRIAQPTFHVPSSSSEGTLGWQLALSGETLALGIPRANVVEVYTRSGTQWSKEQRIHSPWMGATNFGSSVALEGNALAIGANGDTSEGRVYYYTRSSGIWSGAQIPLPPDLEKGDYFGSKVALSGDTILATAPGSGGVYALQKTGQNWDAGTKLTSSSLGVSAPNFGSTLAIDGDHALIGAARMDLSPFLQSSGKVFSARRVNGVWQLTGILANAGRQGFDKFGCSLAIRGTRALVGDMGRTTAGGMMTGDATFYHLANDIWNSGATVDLGDDGAGSRYGRAVAVDGDTLAFGAGAESNASGLRPEVVHIFTRVGTGWTHQARLEDPSPMEDPFLTTGFGSSLAISGGTLVAASPIRSNGTYPPAQDGSVYFYERSGAQWNLVSELPGIGQFGISLAAEGNTVAIGAPSFPLPGEPLKQGKVFIYTRGAASWTQTGELQATADAGYNNFGRSLALDGGTLLVGAPYSLGEEWDNTPHGAVVFFRNSGTEWEQETVIGNPLAEGFFGYSVDISGDHALVAVPGYEYASYLFLNRDGSTWTSGDLHYLEGFRSLTGNQVALDGHAAAISADNSTSAPGVCKLLEFAAGHWLPSRDLGTTGTAVAMDGNTLVVGDSLAQRSNPDMPDFSARTGHVWIFGLSGAEKFLLQSFDQNQDLLLSLDEWMAVYGTSAPETAAAVHGFIDADENGLLTEEELVKAASAAATPKDKTASAAVALMARLRTFVELDGSVSGGERDGIVNRAEIALMWKPGTTAKPIDAFWKRAQVPAGYDLRSWLLAKSLPSQTAYASARQTRSSRRALALRYDSNRDGLILYPEFINMLEAETGSTKKSSSLWKALTTPSGRTPTYEMSIDGFVEAPKFPKGLAGK
ncbi:FG-GAP repeat protein [Luteolibacter sp. GHJ8]|uniref:FG-GAP repeat protein n=1 Tax=Luteolibacter rhizosphaerae TaxID=2989719 RepID=A0ABT3G0Q6_9BACT|nr:FG-GAP repeat protein [Luteolibacter rhizosphaerae]MCW1913096.1 FG-GAP repeat protein [Luteolibacter rhizosphaerae]